MAIRKILIYDLLCDGCDEMVRSSDDLTGNTRSVRDLRRMARQDYGWRHRKGRDLCDECAGTP